MGHYWFQNGPKNDNKMSPHPPEMLVDTPKSKKYKYIINVKIKINKSLNIIYIYYGIIRKNYK